MFEILTEKITNVFKRLNSRGRLTEKDIDEGLREVRLALLEADVNLKVVKDFVARVRERSINASILESLTPAQQIVKVVNEELTAMLGSTQKGLSRSSTTPSIIMLIGLQGSGKTTTAAKLALHLKRSGQTAIMAAADTRRPAAIDQLITLGKQLNIPVYHEDPSSSPKKICQNAVKKAKDTNIDWVILDTAGRLHIDEELMKELADIKGAVQPHEILLVVDAMAGQEAVKIAEQFNTIGLTGLVLTKMDGDARGGAALSVKAVTGVPIKFIGVGEKTDALEVFYPDRLASRILGMGDMLTLIEKAEQAFDKKQTEALEKKIRKSTFDLEDFMEQLKQVKKMGSVSQIFEMIPGMSAVSKRLPTDIDDKQVKRIEAIILSMTPGERHRPETIDGSRRRRIARGSGTSVQDVNQLLNRFSQVQKLMKQMSSGKGMTKQMLSMFR